MHTCRALTQIALMHYAGFGKVFHPMAHKTGADACGYFMVLQDRFTGAVKLLCNDGAGMCCCIAPGAL